MAINKPIEVVDTVSLESVQAQYNPKTLPRKRSVTHGTIKTAGSNSTLHHFEHSEETIELELTFYSTERDRRDLAKKVDFLRSLALSGGTEGPARPVKLIWGTYFRDERWVITSISDEPYSWDANAGFLPTHTTVKISLSLDIDWELTLNDLR